MLCFALPSTRIGLQNWPLSLNRAYTKLTAYRSLGFPTPGPVTFIRFDLCWPPFDSYIIRYDKAPKGFIHYIGGIRASDWSICTPVQNTALWLIARYMKVLHYSCVPQGIIRRNVHADALIIIRPARRLEKKKLHKLCFWLTLSKSISV